jgi:Tol biopolymer transport system component
MEAMPVLTFALGAETETESGATSRIHALRVGLLFSDGSWRMVAEGRDPAYSPDARLIAIAHERLRRRGAYSSPSGIVLHRPDGKPVRRLTWGNDYEPTWSPSGRRLAFTRVRCVDGRCRQRIFTIGRDGQHKRFLTDGYSPAWSARNQIAFGRTSATRNGGQRYEIWLTPPGATNTRLVLRRTDGLVNSPDWSPQGNRLVFARSHWGNAHGGLAIVNADGTGLRWIRRIRDDWSAEPQWSPSGGRVAFTKSNGDIYVMSFADGAAVPLLEVPELADWCPGCTNTDDYIGTEFVGLDWRPL